MNKFQEERINEVASDAQDAFWAVVAKRFPECQTGDLDPIESSNFDVACVDVITTWVKTNDVVAEKARALRDTLFDVRKMLSHAQEEFEKVQPKSVAGVGYEQVNNMIEDSMYSLRLSLMAVIEQMLDGEVSE